MKNKWIWITLMVIVIFGLIAGAGALGYQVGLRSANALAPQTDEDRALPRQLMPWQRTAPDGGIIRRPTGFIGYFFLFPLGLLLRLAILVLVVWLVVKVAKAAWNGGNHKPQPAEAVITQTPEKTPEATVSAAPPEETAPPSEAPQGGEK
jgi:H+/Cl- antiporter ClcA